MKIPSVVFAAVLTSLPAAAAGEAEQLDQIEPGRGEFQGEVFSSFGEGMDGHAIEAMIGLSDRVALGVELEVETSRHGVSFESVGPKLLYRFSRDGAPVNLGIQAQVGFGKGASLEEVELRLIAAKQTEDWWAQANGMVRRSDDDGKTSTRLAYALSVQHAVGKIGWLGLEGSGRFAPLARGRRTSTGESHFLGPSLTIHVEASPNHEIELGFAALRRLAGEEPNTQFRLFVQVTL